MGGNLPDNVTDKMIDDHFGSPPDCERCDGGGFIICPGCDECDGDGTIKCPDCEGEGVGMTPEQIRYERECERADNERDLRN